MKKTAFTFCVLISFTAALMSQSYNNPESIVYDSVDARYFISNKRGNTILQLDSHENLTNFVTSGLTNPKGLLIVGDTLISINNTSIQGFKLSDASRVMNVSITGSIWMNDATTDGKGNLYVTDSETGKIYKLSLQTGLYSTLISSLNAPNGILFDKQNNSLLICGTTKIQSFKLSNSTLSTLITTPFSDLDGLARDNCGNIYVSSWSSDAVYVFDSLFQTPPTKISQGNNDPADISINEKEQILAIPNFTANTISLVNLNMGCAEIIYLAPQNNSINLGDSVKIDWEDVAGVSKYELEYSKDSTFNSTVITIQTVHSDTTIKGLNLNTKYYWRVRAIGGNIKNIFNSVWGFTAKEPASLVVSAPTLSMTNTANSIATYTITSNTNWAINSNQDWLTINSVSGSNNATITLTATANPGIERTATITVSGNSVTSQTISVTQAGGYTGIQNKIIDYIRIYPNPSSGPVNIAINKPLENDYIIEVLNSLGNIEKTTLKQKGERSAQIDLSGYPAGIYLIRIKSKNESYQSRIIKK